MNEEWTARAVGIMHRYRITNIELAEEIGWNRNYLSQVLNCHDTPKDAESKVFAALDRIIKRKEEKSTWIKTTCPKS